MTKPTIIFEAIHPPIITPTGRAYFVHWYDPYFHDGVHLIRGQVFTDYKVDIETTNFININGPREREAAFKKAGWPEQACDGQHKKGEWRCPALIAKQEKT